jgi:hypothetical protein
MEMTFLQGIAGSTLMAAKGNDLNSVEISLPIENASNMAVLKRDPFPLIAIGGDTLHLCVVPFHPPYAAFLLPIVGL